MKLKIEEEGKEKFIEVNFFSFLKCYLLTGLFLTAFVWAFLFIIGYLFQIIR